MFTEPLSSSGHICHNIVKNLVVWHIMHDVSFSTVGMQTVLYAPLWDFVRMLTEYCTDMQCVYIDFDQDFYCPG
jgi:hypothetical protein